MIICLIIVNVNDFGIDFNFFFLSQKRIVVVVVEGSRETGFCSLMKQKKIKIFLIKSKSSF